jgi:hypothetical protein
MLLDLESRWSIAMANTYRKRKVTDRVNERHFAVVAQIPMPDGGFASTLEAVKAWRCYGASVQELGTRQRPSEQDIGRWSFEIMQIAEEFQLRFGGEIDSPHERTALRGSSQNDPARQSFDKIHERSALAKVSRKRG